MYKNTHPTTIVLRKGILTFHSSPPNLQFISSAILVATLWSPLSFFRSDEVTTWSKTDKDLRGQFLKMEKTNKRIACTKGKLILKL